VGLASGVHERDGDPDILAGREVGLVKPDAQRVSDIALAVDEERGGDNYQRQDRGQ
jgi:hypothetical protein